MKRNFDAILNDLEGKPLKDGTQDSTLRLVAVNSLLASYPDESNLQGDEKVKRYALATRVHAGGVVEVTAEEVTILKKLIGKAYAAIVVGPAYAALEMDAQ